MSKSEPKIRVYVRKRPLNSKERKNKDPDILVQRSPHSIVVQEERTRLDLSKFVEEHHFTFDSVFAEDVSNNELYQKTLQPLIQQVFAGIKVSCFAYGQTGSGKTYTMLGESNAHGMYLLAAQDLFYIRNEHYPNLQVFASFYEIYCSKLHDLLNDRNELYAREDARQNVNIVGLQRKHARTVGELMQYLNTGLAARTVGQTGANDESSRSHGVLEIILKEGTRMKGKLTFIDLAGSERGSDVKDSDRQTRLDSSEINKSLLALKECIRALDQDKKHTPFRGSKLTQVLKSSFIGKCKTVMIANVSPSLSNCEHTLNTLRYADRVKELKRGGKGGHDQLMLSRQSTNTVRYSKKENRQSDCGIVTPECGIQPSMIQHGPIQHEQLLQRHEQLIMQIVSEEEQLISSHRNIIDQQVDLIKQQMQMLNEVDQPGSDINSYVYQLDQMLSLQSSLISNLKSKLGEFSSHLSQEAELSRKLHESRPAYDMLQLLSHEMLTESV